MSIKTFMTANPVTVSMDTTLEKIRDLFEVHEFHHLLVTENQQLMGIISDRDYLKAISPNLNNHSATDKDLACLKKRAHQIMSHKPICVQQDDSIATAIRIFNSLAISCLPVLNADQQTVGIPTLRNLISAMQAKPKH